MAFMSQTSEKYREIFLYIIFGVCTTLINIAAYLVLYYSHIFNNLTSNIFAWIISVLFAFFTNKFFVFGDCDATNKTFLRELYFFFVCRIITGVLDNIFMYVSVDLLYYNGLLCKILVNCWVILTNYIASKYFIFKSPKTRK